MTDRCFYFLRLVILARILAPHDFGLLGIAMLAMMTLETVSETGFRSALIQKRGEIGDYLDCSWSWTVIRAIVVFMLLYFMAPYVALFFGTPSATPVIRVIGLSIIIRAFVNIGVVYFHKELIFGRQFALQLSGTLADFIVAVSCVLITRSVWALVFGFLAGDLVRLVVSYLVHPYRPSINFDIGKAKELFEYGRWILGSGVLVLLATQGDDILVGGILGASMLGFYQMAFRISNAPTTEIVQVISQVTFPAYSKLQGDSEKLRAGYLKVVQLTAAISFLLTGLIFSLGEDFTKIILGEKWLRMVPAMRVLVFGGLVRSLAATGGYLFHAVGKPSIDTKLQFLRLAVLAVLIYPFIIYWGIIGASAVALLSIIVASVGFVLTALRIISCRIVDYLKMMISPLVSAGVAVAASSAAKRVIEGGGLELFALMVIFILAFLTISYTMDRLLQNGLTLTVKQGVEALRGR
jgi:lipopolysaccharide exporter